MKVIALIASLLVLIATSSFAMDVNLMWDQNPEADLAGYKVYFGQTKGGPYNGSGSPIVIPLTTQGFVVTSPQATVPNLAQGTWYFVATAYDAEGLESAYSNEVMTNGKPGKPTNFKVKSVIVELGVN